jgi:hypothetical protein
LAGRTVWETSEYRQIDRLDKPPHVTYTIKNGCTKQTPIISIALFSTHVNKREKKEESIISKKADEHAFFPFSSGYLSNHTSHFSPDPFS